MTIVLGLSGGIGSGKSTVARMLAALGAVIVDADAIVHEQQAAGQPMLAEIAAAFGPQLLRPDGSLDRKALGEVVFRDPAARAKLSSIVHPPVIRELIRRTQEAVRGGVRLVVVDIPLLFEGKLAGTGAAAVIPFDATLLVWVPRDVQVARTEARDHCSRDEAERRVAAQMPIDEKRALADFVVDNSGSLAATEAQVKDVVRTLELRGKP